MGAGYRSPLFILGISAGAAIPPVSTSGKILLKNPAVTLGSEWRWPLPSLVTFSGALVTWTPAIGSPPAAEELFGAEYSRAQVSFRGASWSRLTVNVQTGQAGLTLEAEYSLDGGGAWAALGPTADLSTTGTITGSWEAAPSLAKDDILIRLVTDGADGVTAIELGNIYLETSFVEG